MAEPIVEPMAEPMADPRDHRSTRIAVAGLGLVGGSLARALLARGIEVHGTDASVAERAHAVRAGVTVADDLTALVRVAPDVVVLAVPPGAVGAVARVLVPLLPAHATVLHAAGLQEARALGLDAEGEVHARVLGTHPLAGSHGAGFAASRADLFAGATVWAEERADDATRRRIEWLWTAAGAARVVYRPAAVHDREMAWASHLPQLAATAVAATLHDAGVAGEAGGPGLRDVTRLAASPLPLWLDLLRAAPPESAEAVAATGRALERLAAAIARGDEAAITDSWTRAQRWRATHGSAA